MSAAPRTARGEKTRRKLLEAAEHVFSEHGYAEASVSRITEWMRSESATRTRSPTW